jgi:hypothetical protein
VSEHGEFFLVMLSRIHLLNAESLPVASHAGRAGTDLMSLRKKKFIPWVLIEYKGSFDEQDSRLNNCGLDFGEERT